MIFDGCPWGGAKIQSTHPGGGNLGAAWPHCSNQTVWSNFSTCKIHHQTCRNKEIRKSQYANFENMKNREEPGYRIEELLCSLLAPLPMGPADDIMSVSDLGGRAKGKPQRRKRSSTSALFDEAKPHSCSMSLMYCLIGQSENC